MINTLTKIFGRASDPSRYPFARSLYRGSNKYATMTSFGASPNSMVDFQSYAGPGDKNHRSSEIEGYQPVSRIGEIVMNAFGEKALLYSHPACYKL